MSREWRLDNSKELYGIKRWGNSFLSVDNEGYLVIHPRGKDCVGYRLSDIAKEIEHRGITLPVILRFPEIISVKFNEIALSFKRAFKEYGYEGNFFPLYPLKVNQNAHVVEDVLSIGIASFGLEVGSKAELIAAIVLFGEREEIGLRTPIVVCNGFKDIEYIDIAMVSKFLGFKPFVVVERLEELEYLVQTFGKWDNRIDIGFRLRLAVEGEGHWLRTSGDRAKFGLTVEDILKGVNMLERNDILDCFTLLHFHIGSQINDIALIKEAIKEFGYVFAELRKKGVPIVNVDVGGGLGVDYIGFMGENCSSCMNYSVNEYCNDVVYGISSICNDRNLKHPNLFTEYGRAMVAHHAVLLTNVIDCIPFVSSDTSQISVENIKETVVQELHELLENISQENALESYHNALELREEARTLFKLGRISLDEYAFAEHSFKSILKSTNEYMRNSKIAGIEKIREISADKLYINLSIFQSLPDMWAIGQLFPVVPVANLDKPPVKDVILMDLTCDSDGVVDKFVLNSVISGYLPIAEENTAKGSLLAFFLIGAYQEILGDVHNLFGKVNAVHIRSNDDSFVDFVFVEEGDRVLNLLERIAIDPKKVPSIIRRLVEMRIKKDSLNFKAKEIYSYFVSKLNISSYLL